MEFEFSVSKDENVLNIYLKGFLDATSAPRLLEELKSYEGESVSKIVYHAKDLEYIASSGIRVIIFTKQKIAYEADIILKEPQEGVLAVFEMSGLNNFVLFE